MVRKPISSNILHDKNKLVFSLGLNAHRFFFFFFILGQCRTINYLAFSRKVDQLGCICANHLLLSPSCTHNLLGLYLYTSWIYASFIYMHKILILLGRRRLGVE